ncbi:MAG: hypothetical protein ACYTHM_00580 [Planctomycetota bacterium]|jgi:hypothetical protein
MKVTLTGIQLGLVWFFGFLAGIGLLLFVGGILSDARVTTLILPVVFLLAGIVFGGLIIRGVTGRIEKLKRK